MGASEADREARHLGPGRKRLGPGLAVSGGVGVSGTTEEVSNQIVNGEKSLGLTCGFEALHDPLTASGRLMAIFRPIVQASVLSMLHAKASDG
jgi:hypothetical protein